MAQQDIIDELNYLKETKQQIKQAIIDKGQEIEENTPFRYYAEKISNISGGGELSDATALPEDVLSPKIFYNKTGRKTGSIRHVSTPTNKINHIDTLLSSVNITGLNNLTYQVADDNIHVVGCGTSSSTNKSTFYIFELIDNGIVLLGSYPLNYAISSKTWSLGPIIPELNMYPLAFTTSGSRSTSYKIITLNFNSTENLITPITGTRNTGRWIWNIHFNPIHPDKIYICESRTNEDNNTVTCSYVEDTLTYNQSTNTITFAQRTYQDSWPIQSNATENVMATMSSDGRYLIYSTYNGTDGRCGTVIVKYDENGHYVGASTKNYGQNKAGISPSGQYIIINNVLYAHNNLNITTIGNLNILTPDEGNAYRFLSSDEYIYTVSGGILYVYKINLTNAHVVQLFTMGSGWAFSNEAVPNILCSSTNFATLNRVYMIPNSDNDYSSIIIKNNTLYNTNDSNVISDNILVGKTSYGIQGKILGTMPNNSNSVYTPTINQQTITNGYHNGSIILPVTSSIDNNIIPENIKNGTTILGVTGTFEGSTGGDATSDGSLQAKYLLEGYSAIVDGKLINGTMKNYGTKTFTPTNNDIEIPEGHYDSITIPQLNAANCEDYTLCSQAIASI